MAIQYVGGYITSRAGAGAIGPTTIPLLSGLTGGTRSTAIPGDLVIAFNATASPAYRTSYIRDPAGVDYTTIAISSAVSGVLTNTYLRAQYKFMVAIPDASVRINESGNSLDAQTMGVMVFSGVDHTTPLDVVFQEALATASNIPNSPSITPVTPGSFIVAVGASAITGVPGVFTGSTGLTDFKTAAQNDTYSSTLGFGYIPSWAAGAVDPVAWTNPVADSTNYSAVAFTFALRPKPPSPTGPGIHFVGMHMGTKSGRTMYVDSTTLPLNSGLTGGTRSYVMPGDFVVACNMRAGSYGSTQATIITPGFIEYLENMARSSGLVPSQGRVSYKLMGAVPDTTITYQITGDVISPQFFGCMVFSGVDPDLPWDVAPQITENNAGKDAVPPSITPYTPGSVPIAICATGHNYATATPYDNPGDLTEFYTLGESDTFDVSGGMGFDTSWVSGTRTFSTWNLPIPVVLSEQCVTQFSMALRPEFPTGSGIPPGGNIKRWNGSSWEAKPIKFWNGTSWVTKPLKRWNGSAWITTPY